MRVLQVRLTLDEHEAVHRMVEELIPLPQGNVANHLAHLEWVRRRTSTWLAEGIANLVEHTLMPLG